MWFSSGRSPSAGGPGHELDVLVGDGQGLSARHEPKLGQPVRRAAGLGHAQDDMVDVVVDAPVRRRQAEPQALRALEGGQLRERALDVDPGRERGERALEVDHAQHHALQQTGLARTLRREEGELAPARVGAHQREAIGALDLVHPQPVAEERRQGVAIGDPQRDVVEGARGDPGVRLGVGGRRLAFRMGARHLVTSRPAGVLPAPAPYPAGALGRACGLAAPAAQRPARVPRPRLWLAATSAPPAGS